MSDQVKDLLDGSSIRLIRLEKQQGEDIKKNVRDMKTILDSIGSIASVPSNGSK